MGKFEMLCSMLPADMNWGDAITPDVVEQIVIAEREACAKICETKIDAERQRKAEDQSRRAESEEDEVARLRHWSDVLLWNKAHEQMASAIRARSNA